MGALAACQSTLKNVLIICYVLMTFLATAGKRKKKDKQDEKKNKLLS